MRHWLAMPLIQDPHAMIHRGSEVLLSTAEDLRPVVAKEFVHDVHPAASLYQFSDHLLVVALACYCILDCNEVSH